MFFSNFLERFPFFFGWKSHTFRSSTPTGWVPGGTPRVFNSQWSVHHLCRPWVRRSNPVWGFGEFLFVKRSKRNKSGGDLFFFSTKRSLVQLEINWFRISHEISLTFDGLGSVIELLFFWEVWMDPRLKKSSESFFFGVGKHGSVNALWCDSDSKSPTIHGTWFVG